MNENTIIVPPEEQAENDRDARAEELESTFSYDGYQVVRKELFAHLRDPTIVIRKDSITFNTACITGLEDVVYVHIMFNSDLKRIVVRGCDENDKDALRWCIAKPDKRKSRKMSCKPFAELVYKEMGWKHWAGRLIIVFYTTGKQDKWQSRTVQQKMQVLIKRRS